jgi:hypothetical protein
MIGKVYIVSVVDDYYIAREESTRVFSDGRVELCRIGEWTGDAPDMCVRCGTVEIRKDENLVFLDSDVLVDELSNNKIVIIIGNEKSVILLPRHTFNHFESMCRFNARDVKQQIKHRNTNSVGFVSKVIENTQMDVIPLQGDGYVEVAPDRKGFTFRRVKDVEG